MKKEARGWIVGTVDAWGCISEDTFDQSSIDYFKNLKNIPCIGVFFFIGSSSQSSVARNDS